MTQLVWLADALRAEGCQVVEMPGWRSAGRPASTGGFNPVGVAIHHTASSGGGRDYAAGILTQGRSDLPGPLCTGFIDRDGTVYLIAAGRTNHAGTARPFGTVAGGDGNSLYAGFECANTGTGEKWPKVQRDAMVRAAAAVCRKLGSSAQTVPGHKEISVTGKIDPHGIDMDKFRARVAKRLAGKPSPPPAPEHVKTRGPKVREAINALEEAEVRAKGLPGRRSIIRRAIDTLLRLPKK